MDNIYDYIIVGSGPWGLTILKELYNKEKNVLCIEKGDTLCYNLKNFFSELVFHSRTFDSCIYPENKLLTKKTPDDKINVSELIDSYNDIFKHLPIEFNTEMYNIKINNGICNLSVIKDKIEKNLYCKKVILAYGYFDFKKKVNFNITNSNIFYNYDKSPLNDKKIACIGGGYSSIDVAQYLTTKNIKVDIYSRYNSNDINLKTRRSITQYKSYNAKWNNIKIIKYKKINNIDNNTIYYDNLNKKYDRIYILIGFDYNACKNKYLNDENKNFVDKKIFFVGSIIANDIMSLHDRKSHPPPFSQSHLKKILNNITSTN